MNLSGATVVVVAEETWPDDTFDYRVKVRKKSELRLKNKVFPFPQCSILIVLKQERPISGLIFFFLRMYIWTKTCDKAGSNNKWYVVIHVIMTYQKNFPNPNS